MIPRPTEEKVECNCNEEFSYAVWRKSMLNKQGLYDFLPISSFFRFCIIKLRVILRVKTSWNLEENKGFN